MPTVIVDVERDFVVVDFGGSDVRLFVLALRRGCGLTYLGRGPWCVLMVWFSDFFDPSASLVGRCGSARNVGQRIPSER